MSNANDPLARIITAMLQAAGVKQPVTPQQAERAKALDKGFLTLRTGTGKVTVQTLFAADQDADEVQRRLEAGEDIEKIMAERKARHDGLKALDESMAPGCGDPGCAACEARKALVEQGTAAAIPPELLDKVLDDVVDRMAVDTMVKDVGKALSAIKSMDRDERTRTADRIAKARVAGMPADTEDELTMKLLNLRMKTLDELQMILVESATSGPSDTLTPPGATQASAGQQLH